MPDLLKRLTGEVLVVDGAMGTMLQRAGIPPEQCPEQLNVTNPELILQLHRDYVLAGADCVSSNTFGGTRAKLDEYGLGDDVVELNRAGMRLAKRSGATHVLADVGPCGLVMEPIGEARFDDVFALFAEQIAALAAENPDAIALETFTDIAEVRCALLAARSVAPELPVIASVTFGGDGRMPLSGTTPEAAAVILEACGAAIVGMNCGLGPEQMLPLVERMAAATALPLVVQPNAGLPRLVEGKTVFPGTPDEMGAHASRFVDSGAVLVGSCCGSSPSFTGAISDFAKGKPVVTRERPAGVALASPRGVVRLGAGRPLAIIGERINPTGKKALADSLRAGSVSVVREYATAQERAGADLLDVNVGAAGVDQVRMLAEAVRALSTLTGLPLVIDNVDPAAVEPALKLYPGRALLNSVNGSAEALSELLPLAARYGAAIVVLALDDAGIPADASGRLDIVARVRSAAHSAGLSDDDLVVDCLTMTAATDRAAVGVTLEAVIRVSRHAGLATVLGVSNVSHGLPGRSALNAAMLEMAAFAGLNAAIVNPDDAEIASAALAVDVLLGRDRNAEAWIAAAKALEGMRAARPTSAEVGTAVLEGAHPAPSSADARVRLAAAIETGDAYAAPGLVDEVIREGTLPDRVIAEVLTPAITELGDAFGRGEAFLPQLIVAAEAMKAASDRVKTYLPASAGHSEGRVVFATVKGDIHSIGKDICVSLLESRGFDVRDLGVDVAPETVAKAARESDVVCLSALMTTTLPQMERTAHAVTAEAGVPVLVGGAVVTADWAASIGAGYAADALGCVDAVRAAVGARR
ncbi:MAG TPA: homocysteine S-methyltransferase family protein [Coriobacteriia bacterium]|jgi:5-methyltetrahydrofolate--homocysteine methyltransferase